MTQVAEAIADEEFETTYSEERAEQDPNYDARRILERDWNVYATHSQLLDARQSTVHAFFIVLGQVIEQNLIDLLAYINSSKTGKHFGSFDALTKELHSAGVDIEGAKNWKSIAEIRNVANYLKHGVGSSSKKAEDVLIPHIGPPFDPELEATLFHLSQSKNASSLPSLPLRNTGIALSENVLHLYVEQTCLFFAELSD